MYTYLTPYHADKQGSASRNVPVVFIVDADTAMRKALERAVCSAGWQPETFSSAQEFLSYPRPSLPKCLLLGIDLADVSGFELQKRICAERSDMPVIFLIGQGDVEMSVRAMKAGAIDVLTKPIKDDVLVPAIGQALEHSRTELALDSEMRLLRDRHAALSRREQEVMALVVTGLLNKQVGFELGISEITVKAHRGHMMRKMQARSLPELVTMAMRLGIAAFRRQQRAACSQEVLAFSS